MTTTLPDRLETIAALRSELHRAQPAGQSLPTHSALTELVGPGLRVGTVHCITNSTSLGIALMAGASAAGSWCATVGFPDLGLECADEWGVDLERLALIPRVRPEQWLDTVCALIEAIDVVLARPAPPLAPGLRNRLLARLRHRGATLLVAGAWPQATSTFEVTADRWRGLEHGHGHLVSRELTISCTRGHRTTSATVQWPPPHRR